MDSNPFSQPSPLPYQLPPFDRIHTGHYREAFAAGMRVQRTEIEAIKASGPPTFANTIEALERSGELLERVSSVFFNLAASDCDAQIQQLESELAPELAAHADAIALDPALFARVQALHARHDRLELAPEALQLLMRHHTQLVRAGAQLPDAAKERLKALNARISVLITQFRQNVLKATADGAVAVSKEAQLAGLSSEQASAAARAAAARGLSGWLITLQNTTGQPVLAQLQDRALRERIYRSSVNRCLGGGADNTGVLVTLVKLRAERALLLGYPSHAAYELADESAGTPAAVLQMLTQLAPAALARVRAEARELQALADEHARATGAEPCALQPWDWPFYAERLRQARYDFAAAQVAPYFELDRVLHEGVFLAAHELYGLRFRERRDLPVYHPEVRIFEVFDAEQPLALFLADYFARDTKQGGAWMSNFVRQARLLGLKPVVVNNLNIPKPEAGAPVLLTFDEVTTLFHEFGHALHGMLSDVCYPLLSGTNVPRDFVEYPSQFNEMWARDPGVLARCARHHATGEPMPAALLERVLAAQTFNQGHATTEYLAAALLDQAWHQTPAEHLPAPAGVAAFEAAVLAAHGLDIAPVPPRYHSAYFSHIFAGGYAAGYYAYIWSEVLARDTGDWFNRHGGLTRANGERLRGTVLSRGRSADPGSMFRDFRGRDPEVGPLIAYRGLA